MSPARLALLALLAFALPTVAFAKTADRDLPMTIDAANQSGSMLGDNGKVRYTGDVVIVQGTLEIHADTADIFQKGGQADRIFLTGKQATLKQQLDDDTWMHGRADNIEYQVNQDTVILTGNYYVESVKGTNVGQRMVYNTKTGDMQSGGDGSRVRTVIQPKTKPTGASKPATPATTKQEKN
jgi:lipopolysaccharide export system protein LptA